ncbi:MAG: PDZ domain-containing protein [Acidimicrobiia bacterium]|nr:PDZ domain-containing protein [Acidimicrobiia bacterium]
MPTDGDDAPERSAPSPWPSAPARARRSRRGGVLPVVVGAVGAVLALAAFFVRLPYVIVSPGDATPVGGAVTIEGAPTYEDEGSFLYLTVSVSNRRPNVYRLGYAWLRDDHEIRDEEDVLGPHTREENRRINIELMDESQLVATKVALERLGYEVTMEGTGALVASVVEGSPADGELEPGDTIVGVDGEPVRLADDLAPAIRTRAPGDPVILTVDREGRSREVTLTTTANDEGRALIGVSVVTRDLELDFPVDVEIDTGSVSGPSAGLAFTLEIVDELTPGDLAGGRKIGVTGEISPDGTVGEIDGAAQKAVAARRAGATLMLVPPGNVEDARSEAGDMEVVAVRDLDEALAALEAAGGDPLVETTPTTRAA